MFSLLPPYDLERPEKEPRSLSVERGLLLGQPRCGFFGGRRFRDPARTEARPRTCRERPAGGLHDRAGLALETSPLGVTASQPGPFEPALEFPNGARHGQRQERNRSTKQHDLGARGEKLPLALRDSPWALPKLAERRTRGPVPRGRL